MKSRRREIAVIGIACRFPGANDYSCFWDNLEKGVNSIREITPDRWDPDIYYSPDADSPGKSVSKWCGQVENIYDFDSGFFNISPREALTMDPQQRILLEETWHCIEDSGIPLSVLQEKITAVYVGAMTTDYRQEFTSVNLNTDSYDCLGNFESILANRISYTFDLKGTSQTLNAACASSLVAVQEARRALIEGECDYALVAGVNLNLHPWKYVSFSKSRMLSPDGQCKTFDIAADGYVPGDGIGVVLLQRVDESTMDKNHIYGVIKGAAVNHVGKSLSMTAPRMEAQRNVILSALEDAEVQAETISYIEAHGTGTSLGDPIEIQALTQAFQKHTENKRFCHIGSVKTNIGHLEGAAGLAGVIKVLLMLQHRKIPATLNIKTINPILQLEQTPFCIADQPLAWQDNGTNPLRAGVSSFGFGGVNAHIVIEEYVNRDPETDDFQSASVALEFFALSAKSSSSLSDALHSWTSGLLHNKWGSYTLTDISKTLLTGRSSFPYRYGCLVESKEALLRQLASRSELLTKVPHSSWVLHIGQRSCSGFGEFSDFYAECYLFRKQIDQLIKILKKLRYQRNVCNDFYESVWPEKYVDLYNFIAHFAYVSVYLELGCSLHQVTCDISGIWVAIAVSAMAQIEKILAVKSGRMSLAMLQLKRPRIPFKDPVSGNELLPIVIDAEYLRELITSILEQIPIEKADHTRQCYVAISNNFVDYLEKTKLLYHSQFTLKKYIDEWQEQIIRITGYDIYKHINQEETTVNITQSTNREQLLLGLAIVCSWRKLNRKWNLQDQTELLDSRFQELTDLIIDDFIPAEVILELLTDQKAPWEKVADILVDAQSKLSYEHHPYVLLKKHNEQLREIINVSEWLTAASDMEPSTVDENSICLCIKDDLANATDTNKTFKENLLRLWLQGADIDWSRLYEKPVHKVQLPGYFFDRSTCRISQNQKGDKHLFSCQSDSKQDKNLLVQDLELQHLLKLLEQGNLGVDELKQIMGAE
ncbi:polyketide synthase [Paenibacillus sp. M-152]|uniref:type I polyketide synthase n=1 Tax=Paenibacillus sp. M-152 TaxID=2487928 RepID=UPI000F6BE061|nr:polyketide synthase [Paenibacillus sp. M-152]AZH29520.1 polyketide synthase [Paenibacillus sp. M-152]